MKNIIIVILIALGLGVLVACQPGAMVITVTPPPIHETPSATCSWPCNDQDKSTAQAMLATINYGATLTAQAASGTTIVASNTPPENMTVIPSIGDLGWGSVYGKVTNARNGKPVANAQISCEHFSHTSPSNVLCQGITWTNDVGVFAFVPVFFHDTDTITLRVELAGYKSFEFRQSAFTTSSLKADILMEPEPQTSDITPEVTVTPWSPEVLVSAEKYPHSLIVDSRMVYWVSCETWESNQGNLMVYSKDLKTISTLAVGQACPFFPQADENSLFWMDREQIAGGMHKIMSISKAGGAPMILTSGENMDRFVAVDDEYVYWSTKEGLLMRQSKTGSGAPEQIALKSTYGFKLNGPDAYWFNNDRDLIRSLKDGSGETLLVKASDFESYKIGERLIQRGLGQVFPATNQVYFTSFTDGNVGMVSCTDNRTQLMKMSKNGGASQQVVEIAGSVSILITEPYAYYGGSCHSDILRVNLDTQVVESFVNNTGPVTSLTSDENYIYWIEVDSGSIKRAPITTTK